LGFWSVRPTQKISEPANLSAVFLRNLKQRTHQKI
jgi:hypothetical protein